MEKLQLRRGTEYSDYVIDKNRKLIEAYWAEKGFRNARVEARIENDAVRPNAVNVTFVVDRGPRVRIGRINFTGNEQFTDKRLRRTFKKTHQKSLNFLRNTKLKESDFEEDKDLLIDFYNSKGFRNATVLRDSDLPDQRETPRHRHRPLGGQQILHPQHHVGGQLGLRHREVAEHVRRASGRHLRQRKPCTSASASAARRTPKTCR